MARTDDIGDRSFSQRFLAPYRRITSSGQFIPEIDGLRFIAIFSVYLYHLAGDIIRHSQPGYHQLQAGNVLFASTQVLNVGVPLFFVISGFILGLPFAAARLGRGRKVSLPKYFLRRVTRLEPPYVLALFLFFALKVIAARGTARELLPNLVASIFYVHNLTFGGPSVINVVAWSLEVEVQFYILAPLLALVFRIPESRVRRFVLIAAVLVTTGVSRFVPGQLGLQNSLLAYAQYFLAGFLLVEYYLSSGKTRQRSFVWDVVSLVGWSALLVLLINGGLTADWISPWIILLLYIAAFQSFVVNRLVRNPWITTIGGMCYSIYLLHNYVVASLGMVTERVFAGYPFSLRLFTQLLLMSPVVLIVAGLYFRWIERPCMRPDWPRQLMLAFRRLNGRRLPLPASATSAEASFDE